MSSDKTIKKESAFSDGENTGQKNFRREVFNTLYQAYSPFLWPILACVLIGILGRGLLLANANVMGLWVDSFCQAPQICHSQPTWVQGWQGQDYILLLASMTLFGFLSTLIFRVFFSRISARAVSTIYDEVTLRTSRFPMSFFDTTPAGRVVTRFSSDYGQVFRLFGGPLAEFFSIIFDLLMMIVLVAIASPYYLIFVAITAALNFLVYRLNRQRLRQSRRELSASRSPSIAHFSETTQGASTIRTFNRQLSFIERFERLDQFFLEKKLKTTKQLVGFSLQMNSLTAFLFLMTGVGAYFLVDKGWVSVGSVGVAFSFIALSGNTVQMFFEWLTQFEEAMIGLERLDLYLRKPLEPGTLLPAEAQFKTDHPKKSPRPHLTDSVPMPRNAEISFNDIWFRYREDLPWVLKGLSFKIQAGERVGVVGRTGSGKSSLIQALFHLYPIERGEIFINRKSPHTYLASSARADQVDLSEYRQQIALIAQEPVLFQGSLRLNLDLNGLYSQEEILAVLDKVGLKDWVLNQPLGLDMRIEERGKNLSLGERQLLCMARCLLQETPVVIMDEATSSVDPQSEEIMVKATEEFFKGRTQIIIAHRLSTLKKCDRILWIQNGEVKAFGPTEEVLKQFKDPL